MTCRHIYIRIALINFAACFAGCSWWYCQLSPVPVTQRKIDLKQVTSDPRIYSSRRLEDFWRHHGTVSIDWSGWGDSNGTCQGFPKNTFERFILSKKEWAGHLDPTTHSPGSSDLGLFSSWSCDSRCLFCFDASEWEFLWIYLGSPARQDKDCCVFTPRG